MHQLLVGVVAVLVQQRVQRLLVDPRFWEFHLRVLLVGGVDDGGAADFRNLFPVAVEHPAGDLAGSDHVLDEENPPGEAQREFVEELDVLQQVVVGCVRVAVLVVVSVDEQLHNWLGTGADQIILLARRRYQWHLADRVDFLPLRVQSALARLGQLFDAVIFRFR